MFVKVGTETEKPGVWIIQEGVGRRSVRLSDSVAAAPSCQVVWSRHKSLGCEIGADCLLHCHDISSPISQDSTGTNRYGAQPGFMMRSHVQRSLRYCRESQTVQAERQMSAGSDGDNQRAEIDRVH
jgi:hypothetical protein